MLQDTWGSDHLPVLTKIGERPRLENHELPRWNLKRADWEVYAGKLDILPEQADVSVSTQEVYDILIDAIHDAAESAIPRQTVRSKHTPLPFWNEACSEAIKARNRARNRWKRHGQDADKDAYYELSGRAQAILKQASMAH